MQQISMNIRHFFTVTQRISVTSQICMGVMKERLALHNQRFDHVMIWLELQYQIATNGVGTGKLELQSSCHPAENPWFDDRSSSQPRTCHHHRVVWWLLTWIGDFRSVSTRAVAGLAVTFGNSCNNWTHIIKVMKPNFWILFNMSQNSKLCWKLIWTAF
jgi:hypothetical protein